MFKQTNTLRRNFVHNRVIRDNTNNTKKAGVYVVPCKDCESVYVGETGRDLSTRKREHINACRTGNTSNAIATHTLQDGHRINFEKATLVCQNNKFQERRVIEGALIHQLKTFPGNKSFSTDDDLTSLLICKSAPLKYKELLHAVPSAPIHILPRNLRGLVQPSLQQPLPHDQPPGPILRRSSRLLNAPRVDYTE